VLVEFSVQDGILHDARPHRSGGRQSVPTAARAPARTAFNAASASDQNKLLLFLSSL